MTKQREYAIDFLKFFAALLITNSHLELFEPQYKFATGGAIGDVLFFFCSGYTLFMGRMGRFDNWFKRRLTRIFPPVLCMGILAAFFWGVNNSLKDVIINGGGWFVQCILIYYIIAYPIRKYAAAYLRQINVAVALIVVIWFFMICNQPSFSFYGWNYCKWAAFFLFFIQGAYIGLHRNDNRQKTSCVKSLLVLAGCTILWYGLLIIQNKYNLSISLQLLSLIPLMGVSDSFYKLCRSDYMMNLFNNRYLNIIFKFIGGLCFEIYLVQFIIFENITSAVSYPYNMFFIWVTIFLWAYILHIFTNFCLQTLREQDYNWKSIFKI